MRGAIIALIALGLALAPTASADATETASDGPVGPDACTETGGAVGVNTNSCKQLVVGTAEYVLGLVGL